MRLEFPQSLQNTAERVGSVCVIHEHLKLSFRRNQFQASRHLWRFPKTQDRTSQVNSQRLRGSERCDRICDVEAANQWKTNEVTPTARVKLVRRSREFGAIVWSAE